MTIGIMGGTFDPVHLGHLRAAETAREALGLARVLLVPAGQPPHRATPAASALDRWAMVCLATAQVAGLEASDVEIGRSGPSYTVDTLETFHATLPDSDLVLIVGGDTLPEMASWRSPERIAALCRVAVVTRPGHVGGPAAALPAWATSVSGPALDVSASQIRELLRAGRSARHLIPDSVAAHIAKRGLYR